MSKAQLKSKILSELAYETRGNIAAVCTYINNKTNYSIPAYGSKEQLLSGLQGVDPCVLETAMLSVLPDSFECDEDDELKDEEVDMGDEEDEEDACDSLDDEDCDCDDEED